MIFFFEQSIPVLKLRKYIYAYRNRYTVQGYGVQQYHPKYTKGHKKTRNYN